MKEEDKGLMPLLAAGTEQSIEEIKEMLATADKHRAYSRQIFAVAAYRLRLKCEEEAAFELSYSQYMLEEYGYERAAAYRYAQAGEVIQGLSTVVDREYLPRSIYQAVQLGNLPLEVRAVCWHRLIAAYKPKDITSRLLSQVLPGWLDQDKPQVQKIEPEGKKTEPCQKVGPDPEKTDPEEPELEEPELEEPELEEPELEEPEVVEAELVEQPRPAWPEYQLKFPPLGLERRNRRKLAVLGVKLVRMVPTNVGLAIYLWTEHEQVEKDCGWQMLHFGNQRQVQEAWDKLMESDTAIDS